MQLLICARSAAGADSAELAEMSTILDYYRDMNQQNPKTLRIDDDILTEGNYGRKLKVGSNNFYIIGKYSSYQVSVLIANSIASPLYKSLLRKPSIYWYS
jgi:hypothetical protein